MVADHILKTSQSSPGEDGLQQGSGWLGPHKTESSQSSPGEDGLQHGLGITREQDPRLSQSSPGEDGLQQVAGWLIKQVDARVSILSGRGWVATCIDCGGSMTGDG